MSILPRGLIVSAQARADNPLHGPGFMAAMARAASSGGAVGLRANGPQDVAAIKRVTRLPVIGINKIFSETEAVYITPTPEAARAVIDAGAQIVGLDCTARLRAGPGWRAVIETIKASGCEVLADVSDLPEGLAAAEAGADFVATTLSGYVGEMVGRRAPPDIALVAELASRLSVPVIAEGRFDTPALARQGLDAGAHAVVVGTMITNPREITRRFVEAVSEDLVT